MILRHHDILDLLKTLSDEHRLKMLALMHDQERTVSEMAGLLQRSEPTISHHVSRMHQAGLLLLRTAGNQRFYSVDKNRLAYFKEMMRDLEVIAAESMDNSGDAWIDALPFNADEKKVLRTYTQNRRLQQIPAKDKKWLVVLRWLVTLFDPSMRYTEKQVNAILGEVYDDYATLRRDLVDYGFMRRERGGGDYWLTPENE